LAASVGQLDARFASIIRCKSATNHFGSTS
jgi:hypothetical protein